MIKKNQILRSWIAIVHLFLGCSNQTEKAVLPYRAQVLHFKPRPGATTGHWEVSEQVLQTLENPNLVRGSFFEILTGRNLSINFTVGSLISGQVSGATTQSPARYRIANGTLIPRDTTTLLLFSAFHSFDQIFEKIEPATGVKPKTLTDLVGGRYQILFEPTIDEKIHNTETRFSVKMNAAFNADANNFILFRRSNGEDVPLSANVKVLSHEFGHALFKYSFFGQRNDLCQLETTSNTNQKINDKFFLGRLGTEYAISGLNEGYADFNSFVMTGDVNPLEGSFSDIEITSRSLAGAKFTFSELASPEVCRGKFYCIGTLFARALFQVASRYQSGSTELMTFSRKVFSALVNTEKSMRDEIPLKIMPLPSRDAINCKRRSAIDLSYDGAILGSFFSAFLENFPTGDERTSLCDALTELFGEIGFPKEARSVCMSR